MGNALNMARQRVSVATHGHGKLELTEENEKMLIEISKFVLEFSDLHPEESLIKFYQPFTWDTNIHSDVLSDYLIKKDENLFELRELADNDSILTVKFNYPSIELKAYTFKALSFILHLSKEFSMFETKLCLESNLDPIGMILGAQFSEAYQQNSVSAITDYMQFALCSAEADDQFKDHSINKFNFLKFIMVLKEFDFFLLKKSLDYLAKDIKLTPQEVESQFNLLKAIVDLNSLQDPVIENISWLSPFFFIFKNGCRAPLWRQLHGDIAYIVIAPIQEPNLFITANSSGFFINKRDGFMHTNDDDFERKSDFCNNLIRLVRNYSEVFDERIDQAILDTRLENVMLKKSKDMLNEDSKMIVVKAEKILDIEPICFDDDGSDEDLHEESVEQIDNVDKKEVSIESNDIIDSSKKDSDTSLAIKSSSKKVKVLRKKKKVCTSDENIDNPELQKWIAEASTEESDSGDDSEQDGPPERTLYNYVVKPRDPKFAGYWHIQNMFQFIKSGGRSLTLIGLCSIMDFELHEEKTAISIMEANGVEILVNILELDDFQCQVCSLKILIGISHYRPIWQAIINFGGIEIMIDLLQNTSILVRCLAAECIGAVAKTAMARQLVRLKGGLFKLVTFLDSYVTKKEFILGKGTFYYPSLPLKKLVNLEKGPIVCFLEKQWLQSLEMAKSGAIVIAALANSRRARKAMQLLNIIPFLGRLMTSKDIKFLRSIVAIIAEFAKEPLYRSSFLSEYIVPQAMYLLTIDDHILFERVCKFLYRGAVDKRIRDEATKANELILIKKVLENTDNHTSLVIAATGAISKLCLSSDVVKIFSKQGIISNLVGYMNHENIKITLNVLAALIEILKLPANRIEFNRSNGLGTLLSKLNNSNHLVLVCVNLALAQCAQEESLINIIIDKDGVRLLWSLLLHPHDEVKASAAWAICPCIAIAQDSGYMVRSLVGGLEVLVKLLKSDNINVLAAVCATIVNVVQDEENIGILTEFNVCHLLSKVLCAQNHENINRLRATVSEAIAQCSRFRNNRVTFGGLDVIQHLVAYLKTDDVPIQRAVAQALFQLSLDADNIISMHAVGCVKPLLGLIGSPEASVAEPAAYCVSNIRNLVFANRLSKMQNIVMA